MALTADAKEELSHLEVTRPSARKAEASAMLRFAGGLHLVAGQVVVEAELDSAAVARRLHRTIAEMYGHRAELGVLQPSGIRRTTRYLVRVEREGGQLARQTGLIDAGGRPVRGMPPAVVGGAAIDAEAAWRGAFLARGTLTEPGRSSALELSCPGPEVARAMVGAARREERRTRREVKATAHRLANFDDANLRRSARAAVAAGQRVQRALEILGDEVPEHLRTAGDLRLQHRQASLEELGRLADPPMTKDAVAGRIRRLLAMADKRAEDLGIPGTEDGVDESELPPSPDAAG